MDKLSAKVLNSKMVSSNQGSIAKSGDLGADLKQSRAAYQDATHGIKEQVPQPKLLVGGELRKYQKDGLNWLVSLYNNDLHGVLADQMGLGKTVQTISLFCHLIESGKCTGPFLVIAPMVTLRNNWMSEFKAWAPE